MSVGESRREIRLLVAATRDQERDEREGVAEKNQEQESVCYR
jgi:hypothetical protein